MKRARTVLVMENDSAVMFSQPVKPDFTSSGYYCVNIMDNNGKKEEKKTIKMMTVLIAADDVTLKEQKNEDVQRQCDEEILTISEKNSSAENHKILMKLHRQFGPASADRLQRLLNLRQ